MHVITHLSLHHSPFVDKTAEVIREKDDISCEDCDEIII